MPDQGLDFLSRGDLDDLFAVPFPVASGVDQDLLFAVNCAMDC